MSEILRARASAASCVASRSMRPSSAGAQGARSPTASASSAATPPSAGPRPHAHNCPRLLIRARRGRDAANVGVWRAQSGHPAHGALLSCIFSLVPCKNRWGRPFPSQRTPAWTVQKPEYSASRPPPATPRTGSIARPASLWGTARRETRAIATPYAACRPKSPVEGSREIK